MAFGCIFSGNQSQQQARHMGRLILILTVLVQVTFAQTGDKTIQNDLSGFEAFIGEKKSSALNALLRSFDDFLQLNYPKLGAGNPRIQQFLLDYDKANRYYPDSLPAWKFDHKDISITLKRFEESRLRREVCIYGYEEPETYYPLDRFYSDWESEVELDSLGTLIIDDIEEEVIPIWPKGMDSLQRKQLLEESEKRLDSILFTNINGQFLYGLAKFSPNDTTIQYLLEATNMIGGLPDISLVEQRQGRQMNFEEPFLKRLIAADTYFFIINAENKTNAH